MHRLKAVDIPLHMTAPMAAIGLAVRQRARTGDSLWRIPGAGMPGSARAGSRRPPAAP